LRLPRRISFFHPPPSFSSEWLLTIWSCEHPRSDFCGYLHLYCVFLSLPRDYIYKPPFQRVFQALDSMARSFLGYFPGFLFFYLGVFFFSVITSWASGPFWPLRNLPPTYFRLSYSLAPYLTHFEAAPPLFLSNSRFPSIPIAPFFSTSFESLSSRERSPSSSPLL